MAYSLACGEVIIPQTQQPDDRSVVSTGSEGKKRFCDREVQGKCCCCSNHFQDRKPIKGNSLPTLFLTPFEHSNTKSPRKRWRLVYVIAWARGQLRINFTSIFKVFTKLPESRSDEGNLENFKNTSEINP